MKASRGTLEPEASLLPTFSPCVTPSDVAEIGSPNFSTVAILSRLPIAFTLGGGYKCEPMMKSGNVCGWPQYIPSDTAGANVQALPPCKTDTIFQSTHFECAPLRPSTLFRRLKLLSARQSPNDAQTRIRTGDLSVHSPSSYRYTTEAVQLRRSIGK